MNKTEFVCSAIAATNSVLFILNSSCNEFSLLILRSKIVLLKRLYIYISVFIPFVKVFPHIYGISSPPGKDHSVDEELAVRSTNE